MNRYRDIVERTLLEYAAIPYAYGDIERQVVFDRERDHYLLLSVGWDKYRVHGVVFHVDIKDGKLWVQCDNTDVGIAGEFERAGVPREDIVLGFKPPELRKHTDYAVA